MHHPVSGINFCIHCINLISPVSIHLFIHLSTHLCHHHHYQHHSFTRGSIPTFSTNLFHLNSLLTPDCLHRSLDWTGLITFIGLFFCSFFIYILLFVPCHKLATYCTLNHPVCHIVLYNDVKSPSRKYRRHVDTVILSNVQNAKVVDAEKRLVEPSFVAVHSVESWTNGRTATHLKCLSTVTRQRPVPPPSLSRIMKKPVSFYLLSLPTLTTGSNVSVDCWRTDKVDVLLLLITEHPLY